MHKKSFVPMPDGRETTLYILTLDGITAEISDFGATLHRLYAPGRDGTLADVILGFDTPAEYIASTTFTGAIVGRNCNRVDKGRFTLNGKEYQMPVNDGENNCHSGPDFYKDRLWEVVGATDTKLVLHLDSPDGDQGFPGNASITVTYALEPGGTLRISYDAFCDRDTVFNLTNHSLFNMFGHDKPEKAMEMLLCMPGETFTPDDAGSIPTGVELPVAGTPMDFRTPKPIGRDLGIDYEALRLQGGYDHNFATKDGVAAILTDPESGRTMTIRTDCPGLQFYGGNFLKGDAGKDGAHYCYRGGIALETQFYPNALNHPTWAKPITKKGEKYHSETTYTFTVE